MSNMIPRYDTKLFTEIWDEADEFIYDYKHAGIPTTISDSNATTLYYLLYARYGNNPIANYDENQFKYKVLSIIYQYGPTWEKRLSVQNTLRTLQISDLIDDGSLHELFDHTGSSTSDKTSSGTNSRESTGSSTNTGTVSVDTDNTTDDITNHAFNPSTAPATDAFTPLTYINQQEAKQNTLDGSQLTTNNLAGSNTSSDEGEYSGTDNIENSDTANNELTRTFTAGKLKAYEHLLALLDSDVTGEFIARFKVCFKQFVLPERTWIYVTEIEEGDEDDGQ